ncbi:MAG TPA: hypothetical protein VHL58_03425 [Thermoanaerobaculia bacterium]|nr:hypothetical protein [Thermoanaerobaculia bacterium]
MRSLILVASLLCLVPNVCGGDVAVGFSPFASTVIVARGETESLSFHDREGRLVATRHGLRHPRRVVVSEARFAVLDPIDNLLLIGDARKRTTHMLKMAGGPSAAVFSGGSLFVVLRDRNSLIRVGDDVEQTVRCERDPAFIGENAGKIYVYSRIPGSLAEYDGSTLLQTRRMDLAPFASSMVIAGKKALLTYPGTGEIRTVFLNELATSSSVKVGATPIDIVVITNRSVLSPESFAVADPASKRIWRSDGKQSLSEAATRGFLRGFIGLGLSSPSSADFPTGIDRLWVAGNRMIALDSSEGVLYEAARGKSRRIATGVDASAVAVSAGTVFFWSSTSSHLELFGLALDM